MNEDRPRVPLPPATGGSDEAADPGRASSRPAPDGAPAEAMPEGPTEGSSEVSTDGSIEGSSVGSSDASSEGSTEDLSEGAELEVLDPGALRRWAFRARAALAAHRPRIDALNVYPVPDGDTGTNMLHTLSGTLRGLRSHPAPEAEPPAVADEALQRPADPDGQPGESPEMPVETPKEVETPTEPIESAEPSQRPDTGAPAEPGAAGESGNARSPQPTRRGVNVFPERWRRSEPPRSETTWEALTHSTVVAARGNSGAILSELIRGLTQTMASARGRVDGPALAKALRVASERAWTAVGRPVEGTMLSVAEGAATAADRAAEQGGRLSDVSEAAVEGAREALAATPEQLPTLKQAGVVDAGGAGLVVMLTALHDVVTGRAAGPRRGAPGGQSGAAVEGDLVATDAAHATDTAGPADTSDTPDAADRDGDAPAGGDPVACQVEQPGHVEVTYVAVGLDDAGRDRLRASLDGLGDSVVLAGAGESLFVHVHVPADAVQSAVDAAGEAGTRDVQRVRTETLPDSAARPPEPAAAPVDGPISVLSVGVRMLTPGRHLDCASDMPARLRAALTEATISPVLLVTDCVDVVRTEVDAAAADGIDVVLVAAPGPAAAVAALAVYDPQAPAAQVAEEMRVAAAAVRSATLPEVAGAADGAVAVDDTEIADGAGVALTAEAAPGAESADGAGDARTPKADDGAEVPERAGVDAVSDAAIRLVDDLLADAGDGPELLTLLARPDATRAVRAVCEHLARTHEELQVQSLELTDSGGPVLIAGVE